MNIVQLYDHFRERGGVERVVAMLANGWQQRGHDVALVVRQGPVQDVFPLEAGVRRVSLAADAPTGRLGRLLRYVRDLPALRRLPALREADVVIANGPWCALLMLLAWRVWPGARPGPAIVVCDHNSPDAFGSLTRWLGRRLYPLADAVVALTEQQATQYRDHTRRVVVVPNPVVLPSAQQRARPAEARIVLAVGRLTPQKGYDLLLRAWRTAAPSLPAHHLRIVGDGPELPGLQALAAELGISDRVSFLPATDNLASHYAAAAAFVLSSRYEGLPLVLLEALAHGLPVVSFDCDYGPRQLIRPGENGLLCEAEQPHALAEGLMAALGQPARLPAMSDAARRSIQPYELQAALARWDTLLAELTGSGRR